jgi:hypothetical protein
MQAARSERAGSDAAGRIDYRARIAAIRPDPHAVLIVAAAIVLLLEALRGSRVILTSPALPALQGLVAALAFVLVWREQDRLRFWPLFGAGLAFQLAWVAVHLVNGVESDGDSSGVYSATGRALLDGHYPESEYPAGAVVLFALEALLAGGGGSAVRVSHAFVMVPFQLVTALAIWALRTRWSGWFAAIVALWPLNAFYWEFKFDSAPTAALAVGLLLAARARWHSSAVVLGLGAALKWTPALSGLLLAIWLFGNGRRRNAAAYAGVLIGTFVLVHLPFLLVWQGEVLNAYERQVGRGLTPESIFYIPLRALGLADFPGQIWHEAIVPAWADPAATAVQVLAILALAFAALRVKGHVAAVAVAAMGPVVFLLTNRVFSPQFFVLFVAAWALCGSLLARSAIDELGLGLVMFGGTLANLLVYPVIVTHWGVFSALLFLLSFTATGWVLIRAFGRPVHVDHAATRASPTGSLD